MESTLRILYTALRKHAYSNILNISPPKNENFQIKNSDRFYISTENIACGYSLEPARRGSSNEYHNLCFCVEIRNIMFTLVNPSFTIQKWGLRGSKLYRYVFVMVYMYLDIGDGILLRDCHYIVVIRRQ